MSDRDERAQTRDFVIEAATKARYVRLHVQRYGRLPEWHAGAGGDSWFFADEIIVR